MSQHDKIFQQDNKQIKLDMLLSSLQHHQQELKNIYNFFHQYMYLTIYNDDQILIHIYHKNDNVYL